MEDSIQPVNVEAEKRAHFEPLYPALRREFERQTTSAS